LKRFLQQHNTGRGWYWIWYVKGAALDGKTFLLHIFNDILSYSDDPGSWQRTKIIPILKPEKDSSSFDAYHPCARKTFEKIILTRMEYWAENTKLCLHAVWFPEGPCNEKLCGVAFNGHPDVFRVQAADLGGVLGHLLSI
jgi:hypothetical protein